MYLILNEYGMPTGFEFVDYTEACKHLDHCPDGWSIGIIGYDPNSNPLNNPSLHDEDVADSYFNH